MEEDVSRAKSAEGVIEPPCEPISEWRRQQNGDWQLRLKSKTTPCVLGSVYPALEHETANYNAVVYLDEDDQPHKRFMDILAAKKWVDATWIKSDLFQTLCTPRPERNRSSAATKKDQP